MHSIGKPSGVAPTSCRRSDDFVTTIKRQPKNRFVVTSSMNNGVDATMVIDRRFLASTGTIADYWQNGKAAVSLKCFNSKDRYCSYNQLSGGAISGRTLSPAKSFDLGHNPQRLTAFS
jgi:hypothetical protein